MSKTSILKQKWRIFGKNRAYGALLFSFMTSIILLNYWTLTKRNHVRTALNLVFTCTEC